MQCLKDKWIVCFVGKGRLIDNGQTTWTFPKNSVAFVEKVVGDTVHVWLIGKNQKCSVPVAEVRVIDVFKTGDKYKHKICNVCHCLLPVEGFALNQTNKHGPVRRPSCRPCRTGIDKWIEFVLFFIIPENPHKHYISAILLSKRYKNEYNYH